MLYVSVGLYASLSTKLYKNKFCRVTFDSDSIEKQVDKCLEHINHSDTT